MTARCCARGARAGCWAAGCRRRRRWGRSCGRSRSGMCASSTGCSAETLTRAWRAGAGPGEERLVVDVDSFVGEVYGYKKQGAGYGYTKKRGYHPMLASRADTGEVLHVRLRKGKANTQRGVLRFADELIARVARAGATGVKLLRADSGFWNKKLIGRLEQAGWQYSISVRLQTASPTRSPAIPEHDWQTLAGLPRGRRGADRRDDARPASGLIVSRTRLVGAAGRAVARLALLRVPHQPHRPARARRGRAPPARRRRAHDPRPQRPGTRALPLRPVQRQQRLDRDRRPRAQPARWTTPDRTARPDRPRRPHPAPPTAADPRPADPHRPASGHFTSPPAGPGNTTSSARSPASARSPPLLTDSPPATTTRPIRQRRRDHPARKHADPAPRTTARGRPPPEPTTSDPITHHNPTIDTNRAHPPNGTVDSGLAPRATELSRPTTVRVERRTAWPPCGRPFQPAIGTSLGRQERARRDERPPAGPDGGAPAGACEHTAARSTQPVCG